MYLIRHSNMADLLERCWFCHAPLIFHAGRGGVDWDCQVCHECWEEIQALPIAERAKVMCEWRRTKSMSDLMDLVAEKIRDYGIPREPGW